MDSTRRTAPLGLVFSLIIVSQFLYSKLWLKKGPSSLWYIKYLGKRIKLGLISKYLHRSESCISIVIVIVVNSAFFVIVLSCCLALSRKL